MNRKIRKRLIDRGHALVPSADGRGGTENAGADANEKPFFEWFEQDVLGFDSATYRSDFWREAHRSGHSIGHVPYTIEDWMRSGRPDARAAELIMVYLVAGGASFAFWFIRRAIRRHLRRVRRPSYYGVERARRLALAQERRRQRRRETTNPVPSLDAIRALFARVRRNPEAALRLGGMLEDLECYLDNRPRFVNDRCIGRAGGIKRHLQLHAPDLFKHYSALMRYKAIAKRFRQAAGVADPVPVDALLDNAADIPENGKPQRGRASDLPVEGKTPWGRATQKKAAKAPAASAAAQGLATKSPAASAAARKLAAAILAEGVGTVVALEAALALRIDPDCIPAMADPALPRTKMTDGRILDWLRRRRSA